MFSNCALNSGSKQNWHTLLSVYIVLQRKSLEFTFVLYFQVLKWLKIPLNNNYETIYKYLWLRSTRGQIQIGLADSQNACRRWGEDGKTFEGLKFLDHGFDY